MASNVYTKNEILQSLASKGYFIDAYTLDTFFEKWKVEAIFEDEQGSEFYDKNALDLVMNNLFNSPDDTNNEVEQEPRTLKEPEAQPVQQAPMQPAQPSVQPQMQPTQPQVQPAFQQPYQQPQMQQPYQQAQMQQPFVQPQVQQVYQQPFVQFQQPYQQPVQPQVQQVYQQPQQTQDFGINDPEANSILSNISLSDGTPLMNKIQDVSQETYIDYEMLRKETEEELGLLPTEPEMESIFAPKKEEKKMGILEGAMIAAGQEPEPEESKPAEAEAEVIPPGMEGASEFDDMSLLSESMEAQEKFREYVVSELSKKNVDLTPKTGEFKLDVSERTINMIARTMAKKIASHVSKLFNSGALNSGQVAQLQEENKKLEQKATDLEDQVKKLRLLIAELNRDLNSYQPSLFGLYKKVPPGK